MESFASFRSQCQYDLVGVLPAEAFAGMPPRENPLSLFPDAKSVIVVGKRIGRGRFRTMEEGSLWTVPGRWLTSFDGLIRMIEQHGYECVAYSPLDAARMPRVGVHPGMVPPNSFRLNVEQAAIKAGLGELGYHGMFMSEQFGIRQALGLLVTDWEIEPGPGVPADRKPICDGCMECVKHCPLQAISQDWQAELVLNGCKSVVGRVNPLACNACPNGISGDSKYFAGADELHFEIKNNQVLSDKQDTHFAGSLPNRLAAACGRACIAHFEATHNTGYHTPFRIRDPWGFRPDETQEEE